MLDYKLIEALAIVAQEGGFDRASRVLHITQSAVSQRVKQLEENIGQILLVRTTPPEITQAGQDIIKHYLQVKHLEDDLFRKRSRQEKNRYSSISLAINADSLATWFLDAIQPFLQKKNILIDIRVDDQEQTHRLLKNGDVVGCISTKDKPFQGCKIEYMGKMIYHMAASLEFAEKWFPQGLNVTDAYRAPAVIFNRKDDLHFKLFQLALGDLPDTLPASYVPSPEKFADFIVLGLGYGMLPYQQSAPFIQTGQLIDLAPGFTITVELYWHCWSLKSELLSTFTNQLLRSTRAFLDVQPSGRS